MAVFLLLLLGETPVAAPPDRTFRVDVIELNRVHWPVTKDNPQAFRRDFDQFIFWKWIVYRDKHGLTHGRHDVVAFRVVSACCKPKLRHDHGRRYWVASWWERGRLVHVIGFSYRETTTDFDVEIDQRGLLSKDKRCGLR